jgi:nucleoid DNA-binding protein
MTKKEMATAIADDLSLTAVQATEIILHVLDGIIQTLVTEGRIELRNFGIFEVKKRKPRRGRNPRTGEHVDVPARLVVTFKPGKAMQKRISQPLHRRDKRGPASH